MYQNDDQLPQYNFVEDLYKGIGWCGKKIFYANRDHIVIGFACAMSVGMFAAVSGGNAGFAELCYAAFHTASALLTGLFFVFFFGYIITNQYKHLAILSSLFIGSALLAKFVRVMFGME